MSRCIPLLHVPLMPHVLRQTYTNTMNERVEARSYVYSIMGKCKWDKISKAEVEVRYYVDSYSLSVALNPRDVLYGFIARYFLFMISPQTVPQ